MEAMVAAMVVVTAAAAERLLAIQTVIKPSLLRFSFVNGCICCSLLVVVLKPLNDYFFN